MKKLLLASAILLATAADLCAQSAIYACGHIRRTRTQAIEKLCYSGYTTAILFNVNVEDDGSLTTDFNWSTQQAAEAGGIICRDGKYIFDQYQPNYVSDIKRLLTQPTSIDRIEICIGGWGNGSYGHIRDYINAHGAGEETALYRNFKALKEAIPEITAVNNDQEQDYDLSTAITFHRMLADIGYTTTVAPYTNRDYWKQLVSALNKTPGTCDLVYLQTYGGGAYNNPNDWKVFGDIPMLVGFDCEASADINGMESKFTNWRDNCGAVGGFLWNYNSEARDVHQWATTINRIFTPAPEKPVATFYSDTNYGGYAVSLDEGSYNRTQLARLGIKTKDIASLKLADGYKVTLYRGSECDKTSTVITESTEDVGTRWRNQTVSLAIETNEEGGIDGVEADATAAESQFINLQGQTVAAPVAGNLYLCRRGTSVTKVIY